MIKEMGSIFFYACLLISIFSVQGRLEPTKLVNNGVFKLQNQHDGRVRHYNQISSIENLIFKMRELVFDRRTQWKSYKGGREWGSKSAFYFYKWGRYVKYTLEKV